MTEDEMVAWHHQLSGHEFEQAVGDGEGQGSLVCCSPQGHKESDTTEPLNDNRNLRFLSHCTTLCEMLISHLECWEESEAQRG